MNANKVPNNRDRVLTAKSYSELHNAKKKQVLHNRTQRFIVNKGQVKEQEAIVTMNELITRHFRQTLVNLQGELAAQASRF